MTTDQLEHPPGATLHLGGDAYAHPDLETALAPVAELHPYPGNPRRGDQAAITRSIRELGLYRTVIAQSSTHHVLAGNHTLRALRDLGAEHVPVTWVDVDDTRAAAIVARDNLTSDLGAYDEAELGALLSGLGDELPLSGYDDGYLAQLLNQDEDPGDEEEGDTSGRALTTGEELSVADVTWGEPSHRVHHGEVWKLGHHTLVIAKLQLEHHLWSPLLRAEHVFAPYPEPYLTTGELARERPLLLVQPNTFLAGHLIDKHASVFPDDEVRKVNP